MRLGGVLIAVAALTACSAGSSSAGPLQTIIPVVPTTAAPTTTIPPTHLTASGVGPGVDQAPFYPSVDIDAIACGTSPTGRFLLVALPAGGPGTPARSALAAPTRVVIIPGKAVLEDHTGKVLYEQDESDLATPAAGSFVVSMASVTYTGGDGKAVEQGAVNVSGDYGCPAATATFPGV